MKPFIQERLQNLRALCTRYDVQSMHLFGSACTDDFDEQSDIDILIAFKDIPVDVYTDNYFSLHYALEELFLRKVDLVTVNSLSNPYFIADVERTKQLVYVA